MTLRAQVALALLELEHADFCIATMLDNFHADTGAINKRLAKYNVTTVFHDHQHIFKFDGFVFFAVLQRDLEGVTLFDQFLETGDGNDCKHEKSG